MLPVLVGAALFGGYHLWKRRHGNMSPAKAAVHGWLMNYEHRPRELDIAAQVFGAEGLTDQAKQLAQKSADVKQQAAEVPALVERARMGDQNAMGMIAAVRENAGRGDPRAFTSFKLIEAYCLCCPAPAMGPHTDGSSGGGDPFGWPPPAAKPSTPMPHPETGLQA